MSQPLLQFPTTVPLIISPAKRQKLHHLNDPPAEEAAAAVEEDDYLLPGLPDHMAQLCLSLVPASTLYPWQHLPPPPSGATSRFLLRHPSFISRKLPIQSVAVSGKLVLLAATADHLRPALSRPLVFDVSSKKWTYGPDIASPRRWCAAGVSRAAVFVASGIGSQYSTEVARSVEKWDLRKQHQMQQSTWEKMRNLSNGKFSRDAIEAVGWRGKLCMVNVKGGAVKEGTIYDLLTDSWEDMPEGMLAGWRGPAASMDEDTIYMVDESKGSLKKYDHSRDSWVELLENNMLKGAQQIAATKGKVCVLRADGVGIVVVDVVAPPPAPVWVVHAPPSCQGVAIHILPRLSYPEI